MSKTLFILIPGMAAMLAQQPRAVGGAISGTVGGEDGTVVNGTVSLRRMNVRTKSRLPTQSEWRAVLDQKGAFRIGFLPPGEYFACVRATGGLWLDPCEWDSKLPTVSIQDEQSTADLKVTLKKGTVVEVRVDDPGRLLAQHEGKTKGAGMMVAIASDGLVLRFVPIAATETAGRTHRLIVPYETPLRLIIQGGSFVVSDSFGIPLKEPEATVLPFTVAKGKDLPPFGIRLGGIR